MAKRGWRELLLRDDEALLMADNSDYEDEFQWDEEDRYRPAHDIKEEYEDKLQLNEDQPLNINNPVVPNFHWTKDSYVPYVFNESDYEFGRINLFTGEGRLTPMQIFLEVTQFDKLVSDILVTESIRYAEQNGAVFTTNSAEIKLFLGMYLMMGLILLPSISDYWSIILRVPFIANAMPRDRFEQILNNLHFCNNENQTNSKDRAYKIRSVIEHFNLNFQKAMNNSKVQTIDQLRVRFERGKITKQYVMWCRAESTTGYIFEFDLYANKKLTTDLGLGESAVLSLTEKLNGLGCEVYFDQFFNSPAVQYMLMKRNTKACGTVSINRDNLPKSLPQHMERGDVYTVSSSGISLQKWMNPRSFHILTNFMAPEQNTAFIDSEIANNYKKHSRGVDLLYQHMLCWKVNRDGKLKYNTRLFFEIMDISIRNSYIIYEKLHEGNRVAGPLLDSIEFRKKLAVGLINRYK